MADDVDKANEQLAGHNAACLAAHQAAMANRPAVSASECEDCGVSIPEERRKKARGCTRCTSCQRAFERGK